MIVLGGAGYIGSHACDALGKAGYTPIIIDNFSRGHKILCSRFKFEILDILDIDNLIKYFKYYNPLAILHFAALSDVAESVQFPEKYYKNNVEGTRSVLNAMSETNIKNIVFSSTASVYGQIETNKPLAENDSLNPISPYGETKLKAEELIRACKNINSVCLRYFNVAGAKQGAEIGEAHFPEKHFIPLLIQTALKMREDISIFGTDYETKDGTCVRDYIHVTDIADAHVEALEYLLKDGQTTFVNLGTGKGFSVKEIITTFESFLKHSVNFKIAPKREGDPAYLVANNDKALEILKWSPQFGMKEIIETAYAWHSSSVYQKLYAEKNKKN